MPNCSCDRLHRTTPYSKPTLSDEGYLSPEYDIIAQTGMTYASQILPCALITFKARLAKTMYLQSLFSPHAPCLPREEARLENFILRPSNPFQRAFSW